MLNEENFVIVDIETTGGKAQYHRIIEIGIIRVENGVVVRRYSTLVNPLQEIPPTITQLTGIDASDVADAPTFDQVADHIFSMVQDCIFVAHNVRFDYGFLKNELLRYGYELNARCLCSVRLSRLLYPEHRRHNLSAIIERFELNCENRHRALDDAEAVWGFMQRSLRHKGLDVFTEAANELLRRPMLPEHMRHLSVDTFTEEAGVYLFLDQDGQVLYVGKAGNVRQKILAHFSSERSSPKDLDLCRQIRDIQVQRTSGELGATILEAQLFKQFKPVFNRRSRQKKQLVILRKRVDEQGYHTLHMEHLNDLDGSDLTDVMGVFKTKSQARMVLQKAVREYELCAHLTGLQKSKEREACFSYNLKRCKGGCIGEEIPVSYNIRLAQAMFKYKIVPWPFDGPVVIREDNIRLNEGAAFVVDKWCLIKVLKYDDQGESDTLNEPLTFDYDMYKILHAFMTKHPQSVKLYSEAIGVSFETEEWDVAPA